MAFDLVLALIITGLLRQRMSQIAFRAVHWLNYAMWPIALAHSIGNGTDGTDPWFIVSAALCVAMVSGAATWRLSAKFLENAKARQESVQ